MIPSSILADRLLLSKNIYFLRKRKKMSRVAFARYIHMSTTQLFCIERKILDAIFLEPLMNISKIYGIPADEILTEDLEKNMQENDSIIINSPQNPTHLWRKTDNSPINHFALKKRTAAPF